MDISDRYTLKAPREQVWDALLNPDSLKRSLPGCESVERTGDNVYIVRLHVGVAGIKGLYNGTARLLDVRMPESYHLVVDGSGNRGILHGDGTVRLEAKDADTTVVHFSGQAQPGGALASMGMQVARGAANILIKQYFDRLDHLLPATPAVAPQQPLSVPEATSTAATATGTDAATTPEPALEDVPDSVPPPTLTGSPEAPAAIAMPVAVEASPVTADKPHVAHARLSAMANGSAQSGRRSARMIGIVIAIVAVVVVAALVWFVVGSIR